MVIALIRYAVITAARVLATASAALVGLANLLGISTDVSSNPGGSRRKIDKQQKQALSQAPGEDCQHELRKIDFLTADGSHYGYGGKLEDLSKVEFSRLRGRVYVDHAGATLYSEKQLRAAYQDLSTQLYSNPHSGHVAWRGDASASDAEAQARALTLRMCSASEQDYECVFTSGATGAMKLVAEAFPWTTESRYVYTLDNHNSAVGMRELALSAGASAVAVEFDPGVREGPLVVTACSPSMTRNPTSTSQPSSSNELQARSLFAYPLESNFSGVRYDLEHLRRVQQHGIHVRPLSSSAGISDTCASADDPGPQEANGAHKEQWFVLLDAAKACCSAPPDLSRWPADFVALSFYKIFGYPTGLGALLVRKDALRVLDKAYFGGGAVTASVADADFFRRRPGAAGLEDGTPAYLAIASLAHGFAQLNKLGSFPAIENHTAALTRWLAERLTLLRHYKGQPVCLLYGAHAASGTSVAASAHGARGSQCLPGAVGQGPVIAFNVLRPDGSFVGYREVEKLAGLCNILLRTGCFCNPGACQAHLGLSHQDVIDNYEAGHVCWDDNDLINGRPTGAVRVSFGYMSTFADADAVLRFVSDYFVDAASSTTAPQLSSIAGRQEDQTASTLPDGSPGKEQVQMGASSAGQNRAQDDAAGSCEQEESVGTAEAPSKMTVVHEAESGLAEQPFLVMPPLPHSSAVAQALSSAFYAQTPLSAPAREQPTEETDSSTAPHSGTAEENDHQQQQSPVLERLWVYPIKSCAGFAPDSWPLGHNGLLYDREWALVDGQGNALTQKKLPRLATVRPVIRLDAGVLKVHAPGMAQPCIVPLPKAAATATPFGNASAVPIAGLTSGQLDFLSNVAESAFGTPESHMSTGLHRAGSTSSLGSLDGSFTGSIISQSGASFTGSASFTSRHSNSAMWPRQPMASDRSSFSGQPRLQQQPSAASSIFSAGADPVSAAALAREAAEKEARRAKKPMDLRAVRSKFRHLRNRHSAARAPSEPVGAQAAAAVGGSQLGGSVRPASNPLAAGSSMPEQPARPASAGDTAMRQVQICADSVCSLQVGTSSVQDDAVSEWFSEALGVPCWLVRQQDGSRRAVERRQLLQRGPFSAAEAEEAGQEIEKAEGGGSIGFANEGQFLAISTSSLADINRRLLEKEASDAASATTPFQVDAERFRPNLLFGGGIEPYVEDGWRTVNIGDCRLNVTGPCARCQVICTDQEAGQRGGPEPLKTLAAYRRTKGQIHFGILLEHLPKVQAAPQWLRIGQPVVVSS